MFETERKDGRERQRQIIDASLEIIDREGIQGLTLKKIGAFIGISDAALLRHFRSKEEIVEAMAQKVFFECIVSEEAGTGDVRDSISSLVRRQFQAFDSSPRSTAVLFQEDIFREYPEIRDWFIKRRQERQLRISESVRKGQKLNQIDRSVDTDSFALIMMGAMRMATMEWRDSGYAWRLEDMAGPLNAMLLRMLE